SLFFGSISSFFDFLTIGLLLFLFQATILGFSIYLPESQQAIFRTCWFLESSLSEILVTFAIRTKKRFYKSKPSNTLILVSLVFSLIILFILFSPISSIFELTQLNSFFLGLVFIILLIYFLIAEISKSIFYKKITF
ncbi:cation transporting ATPase C-terminal domain-containing protein, partial [Candidatus Bathyarchaeota archaeon]|nr:cation transporting ATPase C-terminal domain-containing protein [Candidatus Bathyarchaeota archaeon]